MATITKTVLLSKCLLSDVATAYAFALDAGGDSVGEVIDAIPAEITVEIDEETIKTKAYVISVTCDDASELAGPWLVGLGEIGGHLESAEVEFEIGFNTYRASASASTQLTGANAITATVQNSVDDEPIENAKVRFYRSGQSETKETDVDGLTEAFGLDTAVWNYVISATGFTPKTGILDVTTDVSVTYQLDPVSVTVPDDPTLATLLVKTLDEYGAVEPDVDIEVRLRKIPDGSTGIAFDGARQTATSDGSGIASFTVVRGATYQYKRGTANAWSSAVIEDADSTTVESFIGVD
jgi:hypothetical protein